MSQNIGNAAQMRGGESGPHRLRAVYRRQPLGWQVLDTTAIGGLSDARLRVDAVLLHPAHGIVLIDLAPRSTRRALDTLRQTLAAHGVQAWRAADIPIVYLCLTADELQGLPHLLRTIVARRHKALSLPTLGPHPKPARCPDRRWTEEVQVALKALDQCASGPRWIGGWSLALSAVALVGLFSMLFGNDFAVRGPGLPASLAGFWMASAPSPGIALPPTDRLTDADRMARPLSPARAGRSTSAPTVDALTAAMSAGEAAPGDNGTEAAVATSGGPARWPALVVAPAVTPPPDSTLTSGVVPKPGVRQTPVLATSETIAVLPPPVLPTRIADQDRVQFQPFLPPAPHSIFPAANDPTLPSSLPPPPMLSDVGPVVLVAIPSKTPIAPALPQSDLVQMQVLMPVPAPPLLWEPTITGQDLQAVEASSMAVEVRQPLPAPAMAASVSVPPGLGHLVLAAPAQPSVTQSAPARAVPVPASSVQAALTQQRPAQPGTASAATKQPAASNVAPPAAASSRCGALLARLQLLERPSDAERDLLRSACTPR